VKHHDPMRYLLKKLERNKNFKILKKIFHARVPIIKLMHNPFKIEMDISFNSPDGVKSIPLIQKYLSRYPEVKPLLLFFKDFLAKREPLNQAFHGGLNSHILFIMIVAFVQDQLRLVSPQYLHSQEGNNINFQDGVSLTYNLGLLLLGILHFFGYEFNYYEAGISIQGEGSYFPKKSRGESWVVSKEPALACEDLLNPEMNASRGTTKILDVRLAFATAFDILWKQLHNKTENLLVLLEPPTLTGKKRKSFNEREKLSPAPKRRKFRDRG